MNRGNAVLVLLALALPAPAAHALDLDAALRQVAAANPTLGARRAQVTAERRGAPAASAWDAPMLELGLVNVPVTGQLNMDPMTMRMIGVEQRVPISGARSLSRHAREQAAAAESSGAAATALELYARTWSSYADAYWSGWLAREARSHLAEMDQMVESARARYASGNGRLEALLDAEAERTIAGSDAARFAAEARAARAALDALRGVHPGTAADTLAPPPEPAVPADVSVWGAALDPSHPRLAATTAEAQRYRYEAASARRSTWPDLDLRFDYGFRSTLADGTPQRDMFSAIVGLSLPLFASGRDAATGQELDAMARARDEETQSTRLELERDLEGAHADAQAASLAQRALADTVLVLRGRAVDAAWSAYAAGVADLDQVLARSHARWSDEIELTRTRQRLAYALARALTLVGRGEPFGLTLPPFEEDSR
jgi:outer membrane protein TolC